MRKFIMVLPVYLFCFACKKDNVNSGDPPNVIAYDSLKALVTAGNIMHFRRVDSIFVTGIYSTNASKLLLAKKIDPNKKPDTAYYFNVPSNSFLPSGIYFRDTTNETITVSAAMNLAQLSSATADYLRSKAPAGQGLSETSKITAWYINNTTRNTLDTQYIILSEGSLMIFPSPAKSWSLATAQSSGAYLNSDIIDVNYKLPLANTNVSEYSDKLYSKADTVFSVSGKQYPGGKYISESHIFRHSGNGLLNSTMSAQFYLTTQNGLLQYTGSYRYSNGGLDIVGLSFTKIFLY
jgi:hypothetical protein